MLNSSMTYPYPILRETPVDYKTGIFQTTLKKHNQKDGYSIIANYSVTDKYIRKLLEERILAYALQIQCISTWYRQLAISEDSIQTVFLPSNMVHERVDICPCIIALENILDLANADYTEDFAGIQYPINKGEVVGIGERYKFDAIYKDDIIKKSESIVSFVNDVKCVAMYCEWEYSTIQIHLPKKQYDLYNIIGISEAWKVPMLNAIYIVPVIVQAISEICKDECEGGNGTLEKWAWYKTLKVLIRKAARDDEARYKRMLKEPIKTAQLLLDDNSAQALDIVGKTTK